MIGQKVMDSVLGGQMLKFYSWDGDVKEILAEVCVCLYACVPCILGFSAWGADAEVLLLGWPCQGDPG